MRRNRVTLLSLASIFLTAALSTAPALAASTSISGVQIVSVQQSSGATGHPNGFVYIGLNVAFPLVGGCRYSGDVNAPDHWLIRIDTNDVAYRGLMAIALTAYTTGAPVRVDYDDAYGSGADCHVTFIGAKS